MYVLKDLKVISTDLLIEDIYNDAIDVLKNDLKDNGIETVEVNAITKDLIKIERDFNEKRKMRNIRLFLLSYLELFNPEKESPTNNFFNTCDKIFKKHFLEKK